MGEFEENEFFRKSHPEIYGITRGRFKSEKSEEFIRDIVKCCGFKKAILPIVMPHPQEFHLYKAFLEALGV